jgi:hypothetical protein
MKRILLSFPALVIYVLLLVVIFITTCTKEIKIRGVVTQHETTSDRSGNISYYTIINCEDGKYRSKIGLYLYTKQIGEVVYITERVIK